MKSANIKYLPEVDHLRAVAAVLIVLFHGFELFLAKIAYHADQNVSQWVHTRNPLLAVIVEGHTAVALFMVLSGFIFMYGTYGKQEFSAKRFLVNRVLRIYPMFTVVVFAGIAVYPADFSFSGLLQTFLLFANLPGTLLLHEYSNVLGTLSIEFQFYLIFPFLIIFMRRRGAVFLAQLIVLAIVFRFLAVGAGADAHALSYSYINGRIDQFLLGMMAAIALRSGVLSQARCRILVAPAAILAVVVLYVFHRLGGFPLEVWWKILWPTVEGATWAAFIACYVGAEIALPKIVSKALCWIGERSFSIYLLHFVLLVALIKNGLLMVVGSPIASSLLNTAILLLPATLVLSSLTYSLIEEPFLNLRKRYMQPSSDRATNVTQKVA